MVDSIRDAGFVPRGDSSKRASNAGFPLSIPFLVFAVVLWNALLILDQGVPLANPPQTPGPFGLAAVLLLLFFSIAVRHSLRVQQLVLASPEMLPRVRPALNLLTLVAGALSIGWSLFIVLARN